MVQGLTSEEVRKRTEEGRVNVNPSARTGKTVGEIVLTNTVTFFNLLNVIFFVLILISGSYKNGLFMFFCVANSIIGIIQELRTKKKLESLSILTASKAHVIRDGEETEILVKEIVPDDVLVLKTGDEIPADAVLLSGALEVNESMLTGESDSLQKSIGETVLSGAFVTSGKAYARVIHVGKENYIETISGEAKKYKKVKSELRGSINMILKVIGIIIVPLCAGLFVKTYFINRAAFQDAVVQTVTSGIGMIPEGLVLLTSIALTLGVLRLAKKRTVVQELYCIETLARVDVLCLDKTGTLTEGTVKVEESVPFIEEDDFEEAFRNVLFAQNSRNATAEGLFDYFGEPDEIWKMTGQIPFSSDRKYSAVSFENHGTFYLGAQQILFPKDSELAEKVHEFAGKGCRVLVLSASFHELHNADGIQGGSASVSADEAQGGSASVSADKAPLPQDLRPIGFVAMSDVLRKDVEKTLKFFKEEGVALKCISGDDPLTVSVIAGRCGLENAERYIDCSMLKTREEIAEAMKNYTVFGRVKPEQKKLMVECLQEQGHTVAMTGDGVNDVLALRQADCSIAMASGAEATKHAANILLLDSDFTSMPSVVREGRRVINNICSASAMYLVKTTFSVLLTLGTILIGQKYPFESIQLSIISGCAVGVPTFFMQLEPSFNRVKDHFLRHVFRNAFPTGVTIALITFIITNIGLLINPEYAATLSTICILCIGWIYFFLLRRVYSPLSPYRKMVAYTMEVVYLIVMLIGQHILELTNVSATGVLILLLSVSLAPIFIDLLDVIYGKYVVKLLDRYEEKKREKERKNGRNTPEKESLLKHFLEL